MGERNERQRVKRTPTRPAAAGRGAASVLLGAVWFALASRTPGGRGEPIS